MTQIANPAPEIKSTSSSSELAEAFNEFMGAFEAFRQANDERLAEIEQRTSADILTSEKVDRISAALDEHKAALDRMARKNLRPPLVTSSPQPEHNAAFDA